MLIVKHPNLLLTPPLQDLVSQNREEAKVNLAVFIQILGLSGQTSFAPRLKIPLTQKRPG